jgi:CubicO group peptidase (beta-lactamase class C family)
MARTRFLKFATFGVAILAAIAGWCAFGERDLRHVQSLDELKQELESLRERLRIPGMSVVIAESDSIIWAHGFGMANRERAVAASPDTIYHLASLTKPYGSIVLQLVEEGRLSLDDPVSRFGITVERSAPVTVWHLFRTRQESRQGPRIDTTGTPLAR